MSTTNKARKGKILEGTVVSTKMHNTVVVAVTYTIRHPLYQKALKRTHRFAAHGEGLDIHEGDRVRLVETKPMSKTKHFAVLEKLS